MNHIDQSHRLQFHLQHQLIDKDLPVPVSNVAVVCPSCSKPTRVGHRIDDKGVKHRVCRKCGGDLDG